MSLISKEKSQIKSSSGGGRLGSDVVNEDGDREGGHQEYAEDADQEEDRVEDIETTSGGFPIQASDLLNLCKGLNILQFYDGQTTFRAGLSLPLKTLVAVVGVATAEKKLGVIPHVLNGGDVIQAGGGAGGCPPEAGHGAETSLSEDSDRS